MMTDSAGGGVFNRLISLWRYLKGETVNIVDAITERADQLDTTSPEDLKKETEANNVETDLTTCGTDETSTGDDLVELQSGVTSNDSIDSSNEFLAILEEDHSLLQKSKETLDAACSQYRTDAPVEDLLQLSVGLHKNIEERAEQICAVLSERGLPLEVQKVQLPETIPEAVHQGCAKEKALDLKRGRLRRSQRKLYPTPRSDDDRPAKLPKKEEPTNLEELDLSKETRKLLELDSPRKPNT